MFRLKDPVEEQSYNLNVLGLDIAFRPGANMERAIRAARILEERFAEHKSRPNGSQSKEIILTFLALGLADELLQMKITQEATQNRVEALLEKIEKSSQVT